MDSLEQQAYGLSSFAGYSGGSDPLTQDLIRCHALIVDQGITTRVNTLSTFTEANRMVGVVSITVGVACRVVGVVSITVGVACRVVGVAKYVSDINPIYYMYPLYRSVINSLHFVWRNRPTNPLGGQR